MLTKQQLLIPRVMCVGGKEGDPNYPNSPVNTGDILELTIHGYVFIACYGVTVTRDTVSKYPHLFRPMPWWEKREESDMPTYIKWEHKSEKGEPEIKVEKIKYWFLEVGSWRWIGENGDMGNFYYYKDEDQYQPADESEYQEYQKQKEVK